MPTIAVFTGFEYGTAVGAGAGPFDGTTGTVGTDFDVTTGTPVVGSYVGRVLTLNNKGFFWNTTSLGAGKTALVVSRRFMFTSLPTSANDFTSIDVAASSDRAGFYYDPADQKVHAWITSATQASSITITTNVWYTLQFRYDCSASINTMDWTLNGASQTQVTNNLGASTIARYELGNRGGTNGVVLYDDEVVSVTAADYPLAMYQVRMVGVDTGGTTTEIGTANSTVRFTANGTLDGTHNSAAILTALSEVPPLLGATSSGVAQQTAGAGNAVEIPMTTYTLTGAETIAGCRLYLAGWAASALGANLGLRAWNGSAETILHGDTAATGFDNTTNGAWYAFMYAGVTDQTTLNALTMRMGYSTDVSPVVGTHAMYAEILITPGAGGTTLADTQVGGARPGSTAQEAITTVLNDAAGGGARPGTTTETTRVALNDAAGGGARPGQTGPEAIVTVLADAAGGGARPGATAPEMAASTLADVPGAARPGVGRQEAIATVLNDASGGGARPGTTMETFTSGGAPVVLPDAAGGGARAGATIEVPVAEVAVNDTMVMPIMLGALACLQIKAPLTTNPPQVFRLASGNAFVASADFAADECCKGVAWVRFVTSYPTNNFPIQLVDVTSGAETGFAVQLELGIQRCLPTQGDDGMYGSMVTPTQWTGIVQQEMNDFMTLRKSACCLRDSYVSPVTGFPLGQRGLLLGTQQPLENSGPCGGVSLLVLVFVPSCDC